MACPYSSQRQCDFQESHDLIGATRNLVLPFKYSGQDSSLRSE